MPNVHEFCVPQSCFFFFVFCFFRIFISHQHKRMFFLFLTLPEMTLICVGKAKISF